MRLSRSTPTLIPATLLVVCLLQSAALTACGTPKLPADEKKRAGWAVKEMDELEQREKQAQKRLAALVDADRAFLKDHREVRKARERIRQAQQKAAALRKLAARLRKLLKRNRYADRKEVDRLARKVSYRAGGLKLQLTLAVNPVQELVTAKKNAKQLVQQVAKNSAWASTLPGDPVKQAVADAAKQYPEAKPRLEARLAALSGKGVAKSVAGFHQARKKNPPDYLSMGRWAKHIGKQVRQLDGSRRRLLQQIGQLGEHIDLILIDMKEEGRHYLHRYKRIQGKQVKTLPWKKVRSGYYMQHKDNLGMTLWSKPVGVLADDAQTLATPPGYAYLGKPRFGKWGPGEGDERKWVFHDQYAYMLPLFFGAGLAAVTYGVFRAFDKARTQRRVFYGVGAPLYGSRSKRMRLKYKRYFARKARRARTIRTRRTRGSRYGGSRRTSRRSGK